MVMKKSLFLLSMLFVGMTAFAQGYYTRQFNDKKLVKTAEKWVKQGTWRQGFTKADPHRSLNTTAGKHPIEGTTLVASVEDSENGPLEKRGTESHYHHIDFQYVVKGVERFGIIDHLTSKPNSKWKPDVIHYNYDRKLTRFYDSTPDKFFIFFPCDWHIAKVNNDTNDQHIRVIVIKVDYVD